MELPENLSRRIIRNFGRVAEVMRRAFRATMGVLVLLALVGLFPGSTAAQQGPGEIFSSATSKLFEAIGDRNLDAVRLAINSGADIEARNRNGLTAADFAVDQGNFDIVHFLLAIRDRNVAAAKASVLAIRAMKNQLPGVLPLQEYHKELID